MTASAVIAAAAASASASASAPAAVAGASYMHGLRVLVLGLGDSGLAMARWAARCGAVVQVWDSRDQPPQAAALAALVPQAPLLSGQLTDAAFDGVQLVLQSPGLAPTDARIAEPLARCVQRGVLVQGELDLFARALADLHATRGYRPQLLAITGTNGKTTVTAMTALLVERTGRRVAMAGNIGPTMLQTLMDALDVGDCDSDSESDSDSNFGDAPRLHPDPLTKGGEMQVVPLPKEDRMHVSPLPEVWVLELSSFQLNGVQAFEPDAAVVLNLTEDHLDWHGSMAHYAAAKARVWGRTAVMVVNRDDAQVEMLATAAQRVANEATAGTRSTAEAGTKSGTKSTANARAAKARTAKASERKAVRFGLSAPHLPGDFGLVTEHGMAWLVRALEVDDTFPRKRVRADALGSAAAVAEPETLQLQRLMPADALRVRGRHNAANALAALALATAIGCPLAPMLHGLRDYAGEPHRVEHLATIDGIDAFDDSKGTNVGATVAALDGLGADRDTEHTSARLVVILGGDGKGQDFTPLVEPVRRHVRAVATVGRDAPRIETVLAAIKDLTLQRHATLEAATRWAFSQALRGDAVLLSPACASLDMFRNYRHRAEVFSAEVRAIALDAGVPA